MTLEKETPAHLLEMTGDDLTRWFERTLGKGAFHAHALIREVHGRGRQDYVSAPAFASSPKVADALRKHTVLDLPRIRARTDEGGTTKFSLMLADDRMIESVIIPMKQYHTLCVSTQAGCRMGCVFCETARHGFHRQLAAHEITAQLFTARFILKRDIQNIVFMGMGEPMDNLEPVLQAIRVFNDPRGFNIAHRHMTLSTCGVVPGIEILARRNLPLLNLAVSINSTDDRLRSRLMPVNRRYPLNTLKKTLLNFPLRGRRDILIEYILFDGINNSRADARQLALFLEGLKTRINLIAYNPGSDQRHLPHPSGGSPDLLQPVDDNGVHRFAAYLEQSGLFVIKRWAKGSGVQGACGQLAGSHAAGPLSDAKEGQ